MAAAVVPTPAALEAIVRPLRDVRRAADWNAWRALTRDAAPFLAPEFFALTLPLVPSHLEPRVAEAWDGNRLVGALPLLFDREARTLGALRADHTPGFDYCGTPAGLDAIWRALLAEPGWDVLTLKNVPADSMLAGRLEGAVRASGGRFVRKEGARHYRFDLPGFESRVSSKFMTNLRRCARKAGGIELERIASPTRSDFRAALAIEAMAWKGAAGTSIEQDARAAHLYDALTRVLGRRGRGALYFLRAGGERIALLLAIEDRDTLYALKIGYDPRQAAVSPGHLMVWAVAADAEKRGLRAFDFVGREDEWKKKWTEAFAQQVTVVVYRGTPRGLALHALREVIKPRVPERIRDPHAILRHGCQRVDVVGTHAPLDRVRGRLDLGLGIKSRVKVALRRATHAPATEPPAQGAASRFPVGSWVRVLDREALRATLDESARLRGLKFVPTQWETCGQVYRVEKHVRRMRDDHGRIRAISGTVLLEGVTCAGRGPEPAGCGRHCPLMFRDEWLEPAEAPHRAPPLPFAGMHAHVRSLDEIRATLDVFGRRDGLTFMPEMASFAGKRFRVAGRLPQVFEYDRWTPPRAPIYVLEGLQCSGSACPGGCDRACALLWHGDWLLLEPANGSGGES